LAHAGNDTRARDRELVPFAAHRLHEDPEVQLAPSRDLEGVRRVGLLDAERDVALELFHQPLTELTAGDVLPLPPGEGRGVDDEVDGDGRFLDGDPLERL